MSKMQMKASDPKIKRSLSKSNVNSPKLKRDDSKLKTVDSKVKTVDSKVKTVDSKVKNVDSKVKTADSKVKTVDSKLKKDDSKTKKDDPKAKSATKLKESKSIERVKPASGGSTPGGKNKAGAKSPIQADGDEHAELPTEHQDTLESHAPSPAHSEKHLALDKELHDEGNEPDYDSGDNAEKRKRSAPSSEDSEKKANKEKDIASPKERRSEEEQDLKKPGSRNKYEVDHTPERPRSRSQSKQDTKDKSGKMDDEDECDYKKKKKTDSADSGTKKDKPARTKTPKNNETENDLCKKYKPPERDYKKEKNWESRDNEDKRADKWKSEDSDHKEERRKSDDIDYKKSREWKTQDREYEKPWQRKETEYRKDDDDEHETSTFKKKPWRSPCRCKQEKSWEDDNDDYKKAYSFWKNRDRTDYSSSPYRKQERSPHSYNTFNEEMSRKFSSRIPKDTKPERSTCNCQCTSCRPKYTERSRCMCSKERQPDKYSAMSKEPDYKPHAKQTFQFAEKPERKTCCAIHSVVSPTKTSCRAPSCVQRPRPFQELQSCCPKKCCGQNACSMCRRRISPSANAGYQCYRAPERTCYATPAPHECLPRRLSCTVLRPTSCPVKANEFRCNRNEQARTCQTACEYTPDRSTFTNCCVRSPGNASPSYTNYGGGSSWNRMQPRRPTVSRNFGLSPQPKSCMDFATNMTDLCGCGKSFSQQFLPNPKKADSFSNSISLKSELALRSRPKNRSFGEVGALTSSPNFYSSMTRSRVSSNIASKSDQVTGSAALQSGSSSFPKKECRISTSKSFHSKLNSATRDCKSCCCAVESSPVGQSHSYHSKRYSSFNRDGRDPGFDVGASNRSLTDRDFYSSLASNSDLKSISSHSPSGSYGL